MKLATIEKILEITPHPNADSLDLVKVLGWTCISNKSNGFKVGDLIVYIRTDTVVADRPEYEFLRNKNFRVKPIRLRGIMAEGLIVPLTESVQGKLEGEDVSEIVGVTKYEKPLSANLSGIAKRALPYGISKTDEERGQNYPALIDEVTGKDVVITMKMDGSSATYIYKDGEFDVCSRSLSLVQNSSNTFWSWAIVHDLEKRLRDIGQNIIIRGELCGPSIQKNPMGLEKHNFFLFDVLDGDTLRPLNYAGRIGWAQMLNVTPVPVVWSGTFSKTMKDLEDIAENLTYNNGAPAEGIVIRPSEEAHSFCMNSRLSFKVVSKKYGAKE